ncbi:unnamed protein product [Durusdinium trenchii]|uniref:DNA (cytosine-5-)-methyltransferase n=1 Tax=Durusdinium trenchii TaxID=1381693 RepID=A0ABP0K4Y1_9DINO
MDSLSDGFFLDALGLEGEASDTSELQSALEALNQQSSSFPADSPRSEHVFDLSFYSKDASDEDAGHVPCAGAAGSDAFDLNFPDDLEDPKSVLSGFSLVSDSFHQDDVGATGLHGTHACPKFEPGENTTESRFRFFDRLLCQAVDIWGEEPVRSVCGQKFLVQSLFTGVGAGECMFERLQQAAARRWGSGHMSIAFGSACDFDKRCQSFLRQAFPERCIFGDIREIASQSGTASAYCHQHWTKCHVHPQQHSNSTGQVRVWIVTGPCVAHSRMGRRLQFQDDRASCHWTARDMIMAEEPDWVLLENVPEFDMTSYLRTMESKYTFKGCVVKPQHSGDPMGRERYMGCGVLTKRWQWETSQTETLESLLAYLSTSAVGDCDSFFDTSLQCPAPLSASMQRSKERYESIFQGTQRGLLYDLSQNAAKRPRTNRVTGALPTILTRSLFYSTNHETVMNGLDSLLAMGLPVTPAAARASGTHRWLSAVQGHAWPESVLRHFSGNGLHVASFGRVLFVAILFTKRI